MKFKEVLSDEYVDKPGTVVFSDEEITIVRYEYDGITEEIAWPTESLEMVN